METVEINKENFRNLFCKTQTDLVMELMLDKDAPKEMDASDKAKMAMMLTSFSAVLCRKMVIELFGEGEKE